MKTNVVLFPFLLLLSLATVHGSDFQVPSALEAGLEQGESYFAEGSYALALAQFEALASDLESSDFYERPPTDLFRKHLRFRIEDSRWRAHRGDGDPRNGEVMRARGQLRNLVRELQHLSGPQALRLAAEVNVALGELEVTGFRRPRWRDGWYHFEQALEWWAGSTELAEAKTAYLRLVETLAELARLSGGGYTSSLRFIPMDVVADYLTLAETDAERSFGSFLFARTLDLQGHDPRQRLRIAEAYRECIAWAGQADSLWLDEALFWYARWAERQGKLYFNDRGDLVSEPDYAEAATYYRKLVERFDRYTSPHFEAAQEAYKEIHKSHLSIVAENSFLPGSEAFLAVRTRNVEAVTVTIAAVDLTVDLSLDGLQTTDGAWVEAVKSRQLAPWRSIQLTPAPAQEHGYWDHRLRIDAIPDSGTYLVTASGGSLQARDLMLVTDHTIVLKSGASNALVFFADALSGEPKAGADVVLHEGRLLSEEDAVVAWTSQRGTTDGNGLVQFQFASPDQGRLLVVAARSGGHQALAVGFPAFRNEQQPDHLVYAFSDRSLYRPGDTVHWKAIVRQQGLSDYVIPAGAELGFTIYDPAGVPVFEGDAVLSDSGSAWDAFELPTGDSSRLGIYRAAFTVNGKPVEPLQMELFRVEEIRLPEYEVTVSSRGQNREVKSLFQVGDPVSIEVLVEFLAGGAVTGAEVEIVVQESPLYHPFSDRSRNARSTPGLGPSEGGRVVMRRVLQTDGNGVVRTGLPEPTLRNRDLEYRVEARVSDASGVEVTGSTLLRMTRQPYFVALQPDYALYRPGDEVGVRVVARNANEEPVEVSGRLELVRLVWEEIWIDPRGREISGEEYHSLRQRRGFLGFGGSQRNYRLLRRGYKLQEIGAVDLTTNASGEATYRKRLTTEGYFQVRWISDDRTLIPIRSETSFIVADAASNDIGYHHGGLSLLVDQERVGRGQPVPVLLTSPVSGRWVLLVTGDSEPDNAMVVRMDGTVRLLEMSFPEQRAPGTFLEATMVAENQLYQVREQVLIAPDHLGIEVELTSDRRSYLPGEISVWDILTRDSTGEPVAAEVAVAVVDDAGFQIQPELAPSLLSFFHGRQRPYRVVTSSSFRWKPYLDNRPLPEGEVGLLEPPPLTPRQPQLETMESRQQLSAFEVSSDAANFADQTSSSARVSEPELTSLAVSLAADRTPAIRSRFEPALFWIADLKTDSDGRGRLEIPFSDSLTRWRATARAMTGASRFGEAEQTVRTQLPLVAKLPLPPFLIDGDTWEVGAVVLNNEQEPVRVRADLVAQGAAIVDPDETEARELTVGPGRQERVSWRMETHSAGDITFTFSAATDAFDDAVELTIPVHEHGIEQAMTAAGFSGPGHYTHEFKLPVDYRKGSATVEISVATDLGWVLLEALQSLLEKDAGHLEALASGLLAALVIDEIWQERGLDRSAFLALFNRDEATGEASWKGWVSSQVKKIVSFQRPDGTFPWHRNGRDDRYMTAYAVWVLTVADNRNFLSDDSALKAGRDALWDSLRELDYAPSEQVWALHALAMRFGGGATELPRPVEIYAFSNLWKSRDTLSTRGLALLNTIASRFQFTEEAAILGRNLRNGLLHASSPDGGRHSFWRASGRLLRNPDTGAENTALALRSLMESAAFSDSELVEIENWLLFARVARGWAHSRESAFAIVALAARLQQDASTPSTGRTNLLWNDVELGEVLIGPRQPVVFQLADDALVQGVNRLGIETPDNGGGVYYRATVRYFTGEKPIPASEGLLQVSRRYEHLKPKATLLRGVREERVALESEHYGIRRNQRVEAVLRVTAEIDASYVVIEDRLPAGFEPTLLTSGETVKIGLLKESTESRPPDDRDRQRFDVYEYATVERRGDRVRFYVDELMAGTWEIRYLLRAETPGRFHALPASVQSIYGQFMSGNSEEIILQVTH